jgi:hypothetical protein
MRTIAACLAAALAVACASPQRGRLDPCEAAAEQADAVLRAALESYLAQMRAVATARDPGASTAKAEARTRERADEWSAANVPEIAGACRTWPEERRRCVASAANAPALKACGIELLVQSYTDEVLGEFAARPLDAD